MGEDDKEARFAPNFRDQFEQTSNMIPSRDAKYTLIFHTTFIEPGFDIGFTRKSANINAEVMIAETANKSKVIATLSWKKRQAEPFLEMTLIPEKEFLKRMQKQVKNWPVS